MTRIIILAAGKGKRMGADVPKVLVPINGQPMIEHLIKSILNSGVDKKPVIVVSPENEDIIRKSLNKYDLEYAIQKEQLGSGNAVLTTKEIIGNAKRMMVLYGDHPFISAQTIKNLNSNNAETITILSVNLQDFNDWRQIFYHWGRTVRKNNKIKSIIEFKDSDDETKKITEVNPGIYSFDAHWLWENLSKVGNDNAQKEYYLTDLIKIASANNLEISSMQADPKEVIGINSKEELVLAEKIRT